MDAFGVYVHVPFCATRCGYCDFNTYTPTEVDSSHAQYLDALERELELALQRIQVLGVGGVHLGGCVGVEVAVPAARRAKRDVDVHAECIHTA